MFCIAVNDNKFQSCSDFTSKSLTQATDMFGIVLHLLLGDPASLSKTNSQRRGNSSRTNASFLACQKVQSTLKTGIVTFRIQWGSEIRVYPVFGWSI
jgi:hypothetical protein